ETRHARGADARSSATDGGTLVHERGECDRPPLVDIAEAVRVVHAHLVEEHFVEGGASGYLTQWTHFDAGSLHVDEEHRHALVLRLVKRRTGDDLTDIAVVRAR